MLKKYNAISIICRDNKRLEGPYSKVELNVTLTSDKYKSQKFANQLACMANYKVCSDTCPT